MSAIIESINERLGPARASHVLREAKRILTGENRLNGLGLDWRSEFTVWELQLGREMAEEMRLTGRWKVLVAPKAVKGAQEAVIDVQEVSQAVQEEETAPEGEMSATAPRESTAMPVYVGTMEVHPEESPREAPERLGWRGEKAPEKPEKAPENQEDLEEQDGAKPARN